MILQGFDHWCEEDSGFIELLDKLRKQFLPCEDVRCVIQRAFVEPGARTRSRVLHIAVLSLVVSLCFVTSVPSK